MENPKFEIIQGDDEKYYFRLSTGGGDVILQSEGYKVKEGAEKGIELVKLSVHHDEKFRCKISLEGRYYFDILSMDKNILATSRMFDTIQECDLAVNLVKELAPKAVIESSGS